MQTVLAILEEVAVRVATALGIPQSQVFIDRRSGDSPGAAAYIDMDEEGLALIEGEGPMCHDRFSLSLIIGAILDIDKTKVVYEQRLANLGALREQLTWRSGVGTPIPGANLPVVVAASVTEPFDPMEDVYGLVLRWRCEVFLPIGEAG